ncbi:acetyl-CoA hydrolase/transferase family protein [Microbulbifer sp. PAAF003]|uniref:acetyl-CoA hydrolase/transferase family protein n=1 Tax=Microbulbifer sp. PAAF003 TaxID=3243375 RepID=UPI004039B34B
MDNNALYKKKQLTPEEAVNLIPDDSVISIGMRTASPPALLSALEKHIRNGFITHLKVYYMRCGKVATETIFQEDLMDRVRPYSSMLTKDEVKLANAGFSKGEKYINYVPISFSRYPQIIREQVKIDAFLVTVAPMDKHGYFNFGTNGDYAIELSRHANRLIVEVNENMPRTAGATLLHISEVDAIVENNMELAEESPKEITDLDRKIGDYIVPLIPDGATIQMGIGAIPNAVCEQLTKKKDLGIHTEVITPGMIKLIKSGAVTNARKTVNPHVSVFTFAAGDKELFDFIDGNPSMFCLPVSYVNEPQIIAQIDNMISVNSFIEIDFSGQVNAEFIGHQFSGVGGQLDFVRGVYYSKNGKTILASSSTAQRGKTSRIVPRLKSITTDSRLDIDYVVTEYGSCRLMGKSTTERTLALIEIAHPKFRKSLLEQAKEQNFI